MLSPAEFYYMLLHLQVVLPPSSTARNITVRVVPYSVPRGPQVSEHAWPPLLTHEDRLDNLSQAFDVVAVGDVVARHEYSLHAVHTSLCFLFVVVQRVALALFACQHQDY